MKLMLTHLGARLGLPATPSAPTRLSYWLSLIDGIRVVWRSSFKPLVPRKALNRRYMELGYCGDIAPLTCTLT